MADLMIPIIFIVVMLAVIESIESPLFLMLIGLLFMPISILFLNVAENYDTLFLATLGGYKNYFGYRWMVAGVMSTISIGAFLRIIYIGRGFAHGVTDK